MDAVGIIYLIVGFVVAVIFYYKESKNVKEIDGPIANVATMFVWALWPVVDIIWFIKWVHKLISNKKK